MPNRTRPEVIYPEPTPREAFSAVVRAESAVRRLKGFAELGKSEQIALQGLAGTTAEYFAREIQITAANYMDIGVLSPALVRIDQVLDQQEQVESMGVSKRLIDGARLAAMTGALRDLVR